MWSFGQEIWLLGNWGKCFQHKVLWNILVLTPLSTSKPLPAESNVSLENITSSYPLIAMGNGVQVGTWTKSQSKCVFLTSGLKTTQVSTAVLGLYVQNVWPLNVYWKFIRVEIWLIKNLNLVEDLVDDDPFNSLKWKPIKMWIVKQTCVLYIYILEGGISNKYLNKFTSSLKNKFNLKLLICVENYIFLNVLSVLPAQRHLSDTYNVN